MDVLLKKGLSIVKLTTTTTRFNTLELLSYAI